MTPEEYINSKKEIHWDRSIDPVVKLSDALNAIEMAKVYSRQQIRRDVIVAKVCWYDGYNLLLNKDELKKALPKNVRDGDLVDVLILK